MPYAFEVVRLPNSWTLVSREALKKHPCICERKQTEEDDDRLSVVPICHRDPPFEDEGPHNFPYPEPVYVLRSELPEDELTDELLTLVPRNARTIIIDQFYRQERNHTYNPPIRWNSFRRTVRRVMFTPELLGEFKDLRALYFELAVSGLETDEIFKFTPHLKAMWIGAHEKELFGECEHISKLKLRFFGFNGWGLAMNWSPKFKEYLEKQKTNMSGVI